MSTERAFILNPQLRKRSERSGDGITTQFRALSEIYKKYPAVLELCSLFTAAGIDSDPLKVLSRLDYATVNTAVEVPTLFTGDALLALSQAGKLEAANDLVESLIRQPNYARLQYLLWYLDSISEVPPHQTL